MTFNLRFGLAEDGADAWDRRKAAVSSLLERVRPDFIAFQEVNDFQAEFLEERLPEYAHIGRRRPAPEGWQSNVLFHRREWTCAEEDFFYLSRTPSVPSRFPGSRWPRQAVIGRFRKGPRRLLCANTHLDFDEGVRVRSARLILERFARFPEGEPAVLMGDFNATPDSPCRRLLTGETDPAGETLSAGFANVFSHPYPGTYHAFTGNADGDAIDWILYRGPLRLQRAEVISDPVEGRYPSDHFPVIASFAFADTPWS